MAHDCVAEFNPACDRCIEHDETCGKRCGVCGERMCMFFGPESAVNTCPAHDNECVDCHGSNPCRECREVRRAA